MFTKIIEVLENNNLEEIYYTGSFDVEDQDFIVNTNYLFLEFGTQFIYFEAIECYSKLKIFLSDTITYQNDIEDCIDGKIKVSELIFTNSLIESRKLRSISFVNLQKEESYIISDVVLFEFCNNDVLFIDPSFLGIKIGGKEQKAFWEDNLDSNLKVNVEKIVF